MLEGLKTMLTWGTAPVVWKDHYQQSFTDEVIQLDGCRFVECTFTNVAFQYEGGGWAISNCKFEGVIRFETNNIAISNAIDFLNFMGFLGKEFGKSWKRG